MFYTAFTSTLHPFTLMTLTRKIHVEFVNPYVTHGLIAFWDGIWNVGYGKHDTTAAAWHDLERAYLRHRNPQALLRRRNFHLQR